MIIFDQRGYSSILLIVIFVAVLVSIPAGAFYLKQQSGNKVQQSSPTNTNPPSPSMSVSGQGKPVGPETEKFFDKVIEGKGQAYQNQLEEGIKTGNWITYKNDQFGYQFSYPATWALPQMSTGDPDFHIFYQDFFLTFKNANQLDKNTEKNYCSADNQSSRCEVINLGTTQAVIDWSNTGDKALVTISHPTKNLQALFELEPTTDQAKNAFRPILFTFKFN